MALRKDQHEFDKAHTALESTPQRPAKPQSEVIRGEPQKTLAGPEFDPVAAGAMLMGTLFADAMGRDVMPDLFGPDPDLAVEQYVDLVLRAIGARTESRSH